MKQIKTSLSSAFHEHCIYVLDTWFGNSGLLAFRRGDIQLLTPNIKGDALISVRMYIYTIKWVVEN